MQSIINQPIVKFLLSRKKYMVGLAFVILIFVLVVFVLFPSSSDQRNQLPTSVPPVVSTANQLKVVSVSPVGNTQSLNTLYPIAIEFNQPLGGKAEGINITILPNIPYSKSVLTTTPNTLWVEPGVVKNKETQGWEDSVEYTITVLKGSSSVDGSILEDNYIFKIRNSTQDVYMRSE